MHVLAWYGCLSGDVMRTAGDPFEFAFNQGFEDPDQQQQPFEEGKCNTENPCNLYTY